MDHYSSSEGASVCTGCPAGYFCPENSTDYLSNECPVGHYCPLGTTSGTEYPCEKGYYNAFTGRQSVDDCLPCPAGEYCATAGLSGSTGSCAAGWYCIAGAWSDQPLDIGNYTAPSCTCPNNQTGGQCTAGYYCPAGSGNPISCTGGRLYHINVHNIFNCWLLLQK